MQISQNRKILSDFLLNFLDLHKILNTFKKRMSLDGGLFLKL